MVVETSRRAGPIASGMLLSVAMNPTAEPTLRGARSGTADDALGPTRASPTPNRILENITTGSKANDSISTPATR